MNTPRTAIERQLAAALVSQDGIYQQAHQLMAPVSEMIRRQQDVGGIMHQLQDLMLAAAKNEEILRQHWQKWKESGLPATTELQASWSRTESSLKTLVERIDDITQRAQSARDTLTPQVQSTAHHHQMRQAYGNG